MEGSRLSARPAAEDTAAVLPSPAPPSKQACRRALVVGADQSTLRLCRDVLESAGFVVDDVESGIGAVVATREELPDLILMDLQLRDVPGREAIGWLRSNPALRSTPIVVLTTNADATADLALRKPISRATVQRMIHEVLG